MEMVMGPMSSIVVTLSRNADTTAAAANGSKEQVLGEAADRILHKPR
jgi:hypothetical protein